MVCTVNTESDLLKGRRYFGGQIKRFMQMPSLWPESLTVYFSTIPPKERRRGLTVSMLLDWMAEVTGITELSDQSTDHQKFVTLLGRYIRWEYQPGGSAAENILLISAIGYCQIILDSSGLPVTDVLQLSRLVNGNLDSLEA